MHLLQLDRVHRESGAKMVEFAGWECPMSFSSIQEEHMAVREKAGLFDVSHMGEILVEGKNAMEFLQLVTSNDVSKLQPGDAQYSTVLNERGGVKDDILVYRLGEEKFIVVCNAVNREKIVSWFEQHLPKEAIMKDITMTTVLLALQGPKAQEFLQKIASIDLSKVKRFKAAWGEVAGEKALISRTGYTGEDGFEIFLMDVTREAPERAEKVWKAILGAGEILPCGLGARDTTRIEAGLCLYGNELSEDITPLEAGLGFVVKFDKKDFIGKEPLLSQKVGGVKKLRVGLKMAGREIPRKGYSIMRDNEKIGEVTSGTFSPLLKIGIAMGYVPAGLKEGETVFIDIRGKLARAEITTPPFYDKRRYGYSRVIS
ncbi:MAG: glycine cleavage system aminomethyltransferase GcvT [Candidatus Hadarchaeales archaeon]